MSHIKVEKTGGVSITLPMVSSMSILSVFIAAVRVLRKLSITNGILKV